MLLIYYKHFPLRVLLFQPLGCMLKVISCSSLCDTSLCHLGNSSRNDKNVTDLCCAKWHDCALKILLPKIFGSNATDIVLLLPVTARVEGWIHLPA